MCQTAGPHHLRTCIIVLRILVQDQRIFFHGPQQTFRECIGDLHITAVCKITLHRMHHDIRAAAGGLVIRQCHRQFRVHDRKFWPRVIAAVAAFHKSLFLRDHGRITHLAAGCRNRQDHTQRQTSGRLALVIIEIPHISFIGHTVADCLCRIDRAAAAYTEEKIHLFLFAEFDPFVYQSQVRIGHCTTQRHIWDPCFFQLIRYTCQQPGAYHAAAAVVYQHLRAAEFLYQIRHLILGVLAEYHFGRGIIVKTEHNVFLLFLK